VVRLQDIASSIQGARLLGSKSAEITGMTGDSREVEPGFLFAVLKGARFDGAAFVAEAAAKGARALLLAEPLVVDLPQILVADVRKALGQAASACYGDPTSRLKVIGITGTNGKTTISYLVEAMVAASAGRPGVMGTISCRYAGKEEPAKLTTAEAYHVQQVAAEMTRAGVTHLVMEVSSHALDQNRVDGIRFAGAVFTNLTQDHLDYHKDLESYGLAKMRLFSEHLGRNPGAWAVVNVDDPWGERMARACVGPVWRYSLRSTSADVHCLEIESTRKGLRSMVSTPWGPREIRSPLLGEHNLQNLLAALGTGWALGLKADDVIRGLAGVDRVPGRLELVGESRGAAILVDYAHTPDAVASVLRAIRPLTQGRLLIVLGCGGDRDRAKRPLMGAAAVNGADMVVVTSDNPRSEDPMSIIRAIEQGAKDVGGEPIDAEELAEARKGYHVEPDRRSAIRLAVASARQGDTVLIAGKGHEDYQILGPERIPFDDREEAALAIALLGKGKA